MGLDEPSGSLILTTAVAARVLGGDFCEQSVSLPSDPGPVPEAALTAATELDPPDEIADDGRTVVEPGRQAQEATADSSNDPNAALTGVLVAAEENSEFAEQYGGLVLASANVYEYLTGECALEGSVPSRSRGPRCWRRARVAERLT